MIKIYDLLIKTMSITFTAKYNMKHDIRIIAIVILQLQTQKHIKLTKMSTRSVFLVFELYISHLFKEHWKNQESWYLENLEY